MSISSALSEFLMSCRSRMTLSAFAFLLSIIPPCFLQAQLCGSCDQLLVVPLAEIDCRRWPLTSHTAALCRLSFSLVKQRQNQDGEVVLGFPHQAFNRSHGLKDRYAHHASWR